MSQYDLIVIGSGPAGQRAAIQGAKTGKRVALLERREVVGGVCINTGTIPSKTFREAVLYLTGYEQRGFYGPGYRLKESITMPELLQRVDQVVQREIQVVRAQMARNRVRLIPGIASFRGPHDLIVRGAAETTEVRAERVVIACGTVPAQPTGVQVDGTTVITSDGVL